MGFVSADGNRMRLLCHEDALHDNERHTQTGRDEAIARQTEALLTALRLLPTGSSAQQTHATKATWAVGEPLDTGVIEHVFE